MAFSYWATARVIDEPFGCLHRRTGLGFPISLGKVREIPACWRIEFTFLGSLHLWHDRVAEIHRNLGNAWIFIMAWLVFASIHINPWRVFRQGFPNEGCSSWLHGCERGLECRVRGFASAGCRVRNRLNVALHKLELACRIARKHSALPGGLGRLRHVFRGKADFG
jgi:uncharacterized membrane protein